eukprot:301103-Rhodomonas_salina.2
MRVADSNFGWESAEMIMGPIGTTVDLLLEGVAGTYTVKLIRSKPHQLFDSEDAMATRTYSTERSIMSSEDLDRSMETMKRSLVEARKSHKSSLRDAEERIEVLSAQLSTQQDQEVLLNNYHVSLDEAEVKISALHGELAAQKALFDTWKEDILGDMEALREEKRLLEAQLKEAE